MATKETSGYSYDSATVNNLPVTDPTHKFTGVTGATDSATPSTLTYTTATKHNFVVGQSVIIYGFSNNSYNFNPDSANGSLGAGRPAVVTSVGSSTTFSVLATGQVTTTGTGGTVINDSLVSNSGWDSTWLPTAANATTAANYQVALEWADSLPIQPNDGRATAAGASDKTTASISNAVANGSTISFTTNASHGLAAGQWISIDGIVPAQFNFNLVQVASQDGSTGFTVVSTATGTFDSTNSFGQIAPVTTAGGPSQAVLSTTASATVGPITVPSITAAGNGTVFTYTSAANHGLYSGQTVAISGMTPIAYNVTGVITTTAATTFTIANTTANPGTTTKAGWASVQDNTYKTVSAHGLIAGQTITVDNATKSDGTLLPEFNVYGGTVTATASTTQFSAAATKYGVSAATTAPIVVSGTSLTYVLQNGHNVTTSDYVSVYGFIGGANLNTVGDLQVTATTSNSVTVSTPAAVAAAGITAISAGGGTRISYTAANSFKPGQVVTIAGLANGSATSFNVNSVVMTATSSAFTVSNGNLTATTSLTLTGGTATVAATTAAVAIAGVTAVATSGQTITLTVPNVFTVGETVTIAGLTGGTNYNTSGTVTAADPSAITVTYASSVSLGSTTPALTSAANAVTITNKAITVAAAGVTADSSKFGYLVKKGTTWSAGSTANVGNQDYAWGQSYTVPTVALNPNADNSVIVTAAKQSYPAYIPTYTIPDVRGLSLNNATQRLRAAGLSPVLYQNQTGSGTNTSLVTPDVSLATQYAGVSGSYKGYSAIASASYASNVITYTITTISNSNSSLGLSVGDTVTITGIKSSSNSGGTAGSQYNQTQATIASVTVSASSVAFTVNATIADSTASDVSGGKITPLNAVVYQQSVDPTSTPAALTSNIVTLYRYNGL
jgi:hypothetical protein